MLSILEFLTPKTVPSAGWPRGLPSGPASHVGGTAFGPSQTPSKSVSGFRGSVPVSDPST